jgi:DNA segregation ATPase FtsK/SpoIIIE, S-DNA-T family
MAKDTTLNPVTGEIEIPEGIGDEYIAPSKAQEVCAVGLAIVALFMLLSFVSYEGIDADGTTVGNSNMMGIAGQWAAYFSMTLFGAASFMIDAFLWLGALTLFTSRVGKVRPSGILGIMIAGILSAIALHTALRPEVILGHAPGGFFGEVLGEVMISIVSTAGTYLISLGGMVVILLLITDISMAMVMRSTAIGVAAGGRAAGRLGLRIGRAWRSAGPLRKKTEPENKENKKEKKAKKKKAVADKAKTDDPAKAAGEPKIVKKAQKKDKKTKAITEGKALTIDSSPRRGCYQLPSTDILSSKEEPGQAELDESHLKNQADRLVQILEDFGVFGEVREIHPGPVVTMFEFQPKSGTKLSKIGGLSNEIAMALEVLKVRVVAPIPGKNVVGFELPNKKRETVYLKDMLVDDGFALKKHKLPLALGKDISGSAYYVDLAKMPHLLIAGTTGSGKSVSVNAMLLSLLYKYTPDDLRLLLVDPKMIELGIYDGIPHLLLPVVTDMSKACLALKWAVDEMERRYQLFANVGARNLASYNAKIEKLKKEHSEKSEKEKKESIDRTGFEMKEDGEVTVVAEAADAPEKLEKLPFIVTVVDELADLMMVAAKDVETSIARLAQKARASGIHLIIATQRPSVDVITGLIKANFPSRISFRVSSGTDSRTIIGSNGAESLLGMGDMLIMPPGTSDLSRVHGAFVEDDEIKEVVDFLKAQGNPDYNTEILKPREDENAKGVDDEEKDEVYDKAVSIVAEKQTCSISMLQRYLRIGYNRSARIVEIMEKEGVVGAPNGQNKREVMISPQ